MAFQKKKSLNSSEFFFYVGVRSGPLSTPKMSYNDVIIRQAPSSLEGYNDRQTLFLQWFHNSGGWLNPKCRFAEFEKLGTGMVAAEPIDEDEVLFSIPRHILLNIRNSQLHILCKAYDNHQKDTNLIDSSASPTKKQTWDEVNTGWQGLIMTMMWENFRSSEEGRLFWKEFNETHKNISDMIQSEATKAENDVAANIAQKAQTQTEWSPYLNILPQTFDTPMFWNDADLEELKGTSIPNKIGKEEATANYVESVRPYIQAHANIFLGSYANDPNAIERLYSLEMYHLMGSRILSRSFHVKEGESNYERGTGEDDAMFEENDVPYDDSDEDEPDEEESIEDVSMVPMADMLNARQDKDNAHLFYKRETLEMHATKWIDSGKQIWNTYGEPPSSDLLRRYGHVDLANVSDIVELPVESLVAARLSLPNSPSKESLLARMGWACSLGIDEVSPLGYPFPLSEEPPYRPDPQGLTKRDYREAAMGMPDDLLVLARVLCWTETNYTASVAKERLPSPRIDALEQHGNGKEIGVTQILLKALEVRKKDYATSIEEDEQNLYPTSGQKNLLSLNRSNAIVVRLSEKYILAETEKMVKAVAEAVELKRKKDLQSGGSNKKQKTKSK